MCLFFLKTFLKNSQRILAWKLKTAFYMYLGTVAAKMFTRKVLCKANGIKKCYQDLLGYAKKQSAKSYHVPLERAGAAQAKKAAKFGQNGLSVLAAIS